MQQRLGRLLGLGTQKSQKRLVGEILDRVEYDYPPSQGDLTKLVLQSAAFDGAVRPWLRRGPPIKMVLKAPRFASTTAAINADLPQLATPGDIAEWLGLSIEHLEWYCDDRRQHGRTAIPDLQHYSYAFLKKSLGPPRLIEAPKPRLQTMQRKILREVLDRVPVHEAAHGFVRGRSCIGGAEVHVGAATVVCFDIADFFRTTPLGRVHALFRSLGYPYEAARSLTRLCSTVTPAIVFSRIPHPSRHTRDALIGYRQPHLPQGAPTSPTLANLVAWRLDARLSGLAKTFGARFTRYADDLTFSGDQAFDRKAPSLIEAVAAIVEDEGYRLNARKTRVLRSSQRQQVTGIVVNARPNLGRDSYDTLKAILHNCRRNGLEAENRSGYPDFRAHLEGRVGWVESLNPARGKRLRAILDEIA